MTLERGWSARQPAEARADRRRAGGNADAALVSRFQGAFLAAKSNLQVTAVGPLLETEVNAMTFRKDAGAFGPEVNRVIREMEADGTITRISQKWLDGEDMAAELAKLPA